MDQAIVFDGQQEGERILYIITPHPLIIILTFCRNILLALLVYGVFIAIGSVFPSSETVVRGIGIVLSAALFLLSTWWEQFSSTRAKTYITDRRIVRFEQTTPFVLTKRMLFWNEALKAKAFTSNLLFRILKIGSLIVEPIAAEGEDVRVENVYYYEDLGNYIDKILYLFKQNQSEIASLRPFVAKPKGKRT